MANNRQIRDLFNATAYDSNGDKLGDIKEVFVNDSTGQPDFIEVSHGLFGLSSSLVPLRGHRVEGEDLRLAFPKELIKDAPEFNQDSHLSDTELEKLYAHYSLQDVEDVETYEADAPAQGVDGRRDTGLGAAETGAGVAGAGVAAEANADRRDAAATAGAADATENSGLVRSEERLNVDKERVQTGEARLRKYVVHDTETVEVPVEREVVSVERTPIDGAEAADFDGKLANDEETITISEERVNVTKETVPVEKVELKKETVRDTETVTEDVAREEFDIDGEVRK